MTGKIQFTAINPRIEAGVGEAYSFTYNGRDYIIECWSTRNADGADIYDGQTGEGVFDPFENSVDRAEFDEKLEQIQDAWGRRYEEIVWPAMVDAVTRTLQDLKGDTP